jgi:DNA polymerase-3 subunit delta
MSALKAYQVAQFIKNPNVKSGIFLFYGSDQGLIYENSKNLSNYFEVTSQETLSKSTFELSDILAEPENFISEVKTIPMFGGTPCLRVRSASKALTPILKDILADFPPVIILLEAISLPPRDSLRSLIEKDKNSFALPCYADNAQSLSTLIETSFQNENISIDKQAISTLIDILGNDREITRREIEKLILFAYESKTIFAKDITSLCGDNSTLAIDSIIDCISTGRVDQFDQSISLAFQANIDAQRLLISTLNHFTWLRKLRSQIDISNVSANSILNSQKPKPHFSRIKSLEQQLRLWNDSRLNSACERIYTAIEQSRKSSSLDISIAHRAMLAITIAAAHY